MTTESQFPPDDDTLAATVADLVSGAFSSPFSDLAAAEISDATASLVTLDAKPDISFASIADRWAFAAAFLARNTSTPLPDVLDLPLADFFAWHRQAARLASSQHLAAVRSFMAASAALATNSTATMESA